MSYPVVPIQSELQALDLQVKDAKQKNTYGAQQQHFDGEVQKVLAKWCPIAEHSVNNNFTLIRNLHEQAKQAVDLAEKTLKKKDFDKDDLSLVEHLPVTVQQCMNRINTDLQDLVTGNLEYRGGWPALAKSAAPQLTGLVDQYVGNRAKQIDAQPGIMALKKRIEEYLPRAQEFVKQGRQHMAEGGVEVQSFQQDVAEIKQKMEAGRDAIRTLHAKKNTAIANVKAIEKTKTWSADQLKSGKSYLVEIVANAKTARGQMKTLDIMFEGLEKRGKAAGPGWKEMASKAVTEASKPYKEAGTASKAFDSDEEKCKKICKDHGVTV
jgi:hypothetical protein